MLTVDAGEEYLGYQLAIDPGTGTGAISSSCGFDQGGQRVYRAQLSLINLASGATSPIYEHSLTTVQQDHRGGPSLMDGGSSFSIGIDPINHLILQRSIFCPNQIGMFDLNARPCLNLYDETGRLSKTIPNLFTGPYLDGFFFDGVNGTLRRGVVGGQQAITPIITSFEVQPYSY